MTRDHIIIVCTAVLAGAYIYATFQIPSLDTVDPLGPRAYPFLVFAGMLASAAWLFVETRRTARVASAAESRESPAEASAPAGRTPLLMGVVGWSAGYFLVLVPAGFVVSTAIYLLGLTSCFNSGRHLTNGVTSIAFSIGMYVLFTKVLGVPLPGGLLDR